MIRFAPILALARAESRLAFRLVRYWVFLVLATLVGTLQWLQFWFIHTFFSWGSASAAAANPRYFIGNFGGILMLIFTVGLIFLGFDIRARDKRERIDEVVDTLPVSNLELVLGRSIGILLAAWIPLAILTAILAGVAWIVDKPIEPVSLVGFLTLMLVPGFLFSIGLVVLVTLVVRTRLLAAIASAILLVLLFVVGVWWIPFYLTPFTDMTGGYSVSFPSDLIPSLSSLGGWAQRAGYALLGLGLLWLAAAIHPRKDDSRRGLLAATGGAMVVVGLALCSWQVFDWHDANERQAQWLAAHRARAEEPAPTLRTVAGDVRIVPGSRIELEVDLTIAAPEGTALDHALFTLNPGMTVESVEQQGSALGFEHRDGLLDVELARPLAAGEETTLSMRVAGRPDPAFAYLDAPIDLLTLNPADAQIFILGIDPLVFDRRYVALMPGVRWLPTPGTEIGRGDTSTRPRDFFDLDLTVEVPEDWLVAGPGRDLVENGVHRFAPPAPVPEVALITAPFRSWSTEIEGVELQLLLHPSHAANAEFFADAAGEIEDWLDERLADAASVGLEYPYGALTMVEIPNSLRGYGGGWRMDSTLIQPAMILLRESSFPTADFDARRERFEGAADQEGGVARAKREALVAFFENDINGGNPFIAAARSFFGYQTAGVGPEALPLDYVWENLTSELVTEHRGFFSVHFFDQDFGQDFMLAGQAMNEADRISDSYAETLIHRIVSTPSVWETVRQTSLLDLDPRKDPERAINVLGLKGGAMAESMLDDLGREKTGRFLAALRNDNRGETYTREDVLLAGRTVDEELGPWLELWIDETALPGFTTGNVRYHRLPDAEDGSMQYQLLVNVQNGEVAPGLFRLEYRTEDQARLGSWQRAEPVRVEGTSAVEVGLVTSEPLRVVRIAPYLSLNRDPFNVDLPTLDQEKIVQEEAFSGSRPATWTPPPSDVIVVDDLDEGFTVSESDGGSGLRIGGRGEKDVELDEGLPVPKLGLRSADRWSRMPSAEAYGKYRRTTAIVQPGDGERSAEFAAELPQAGQWELEYHFPGLAGSRRSRRSPGTWTLTIEDGSGEREVEFDADAAQTGWNSLGRFDVSSGRVVVHVSDATEGDYVQADAIRWRPTGATRDQVASVRTGSR